MNRGEGIRCRSSGQDRPGERGLPRDSARWPTSPSPALFADSHQAIADGELLEASPAADLEHQCVTSGFAGLDTPANFPLTLHPHRADRHLDGVIGLETDGRQRRPVCSLSLSVITVSSPTLSGRAWYQRASWPRKSVTGTAITSIGTMARTNSQNAPEGSAPAPATRPACCL